MLSEAPIPEDRMGTLTPRERQVLHMISLGLTNAEVGQHLAISVHAVKFHLAAIYRRLGVANRTEAAVTYLRHQGGAPSGDLA